MYELIYFTRSGKCPILEFLKALPKKDAAKILREIDLLEQFGLALGMPHIRKLTGQDSLWELRVKYSTNHYRIFFFTIENRKLVMLHAFKKKTNGTPLSEIEKAKSYRADYLERSKTNEASRT